MLVLRDGKETLIDLYNLSRDSQVVRLLTRGDFILAIVRTEGSRQAVLIHDFCTRTQVSLICDNAISISPFKHREETRHLLLSQRELEEVRLQNEQRTEVPTSPIEPCDKFVGMASFQELDILLLVSQSSVIKCFVEFGSFEVLSRELPEGRGLHVSAFHAGPNVLFLGYQQIPQIVIVSPRPEINIIDFQVKRVLFNVPLFRGFSHIHEGGGTVSLSFRKRQRLLEGQLLDMHNIELLPETDSFPPEPEGDLSDLQQINCYGLFHFKQYLAKDSTKHKVVDDLFQNEIQSKIEKLVFYDVGNLLLLVDGLGTLKVIRLGYRKEERLRLCYKFAEKIVTLDVSVLGTFVLMAFRDSVRLFMLLDKSLQKVHSELVQNCNATTFSRCNRYYGYTTGQLIIVRSLNTLEHVATLSGHTSLVRRLQFVGVRDLVSLSSNGVLVHQAPYFIKVAELPRKKVQFVRMDPVLRLVLVGLEGSQIQVRSLIDSYQTSVDFKEGLVALDAVICSEERTLLVALNNGSVRVFTWPFLEFGVDEFSFLDYRLHHMPLSAMAVNRTSKSLAVGGEDGVVVISALVFYQDGKFNEYETYFEAIGDGPTTIESNNNNEIRKLIIVHEQVEAEEEAQFKTLKERVASCQHQIRELDLISRKKHDKLSEEVLHFREFNQNSLHQVQQRTEQTKAALKQLFDQQEQALRARAAETRAGLQRTIQQGEKELARILEWQQQERMRYYKSKEELQRKFEMSRCLSILVWKANLSKEIRKSQVEGEHNRSVLQDFAGQLAGKEKDLQVRLRQFELLRGEIEEENKELRERIFKGMGLSPAEQTQLSEEIRTANYNNFEKQLMIDDMQRLNLFLEDLRKGLHLEMEQLRENRLDINREEQRTEINSSLLHIKTHVEKLESLIEEVEAQNRSLLAEVAVLKYETDDQEETSHRLFESLHLCRISNDKKMHRIEEAALNKLQVGSRLGLNKSSIAGAKRWQYKCVERYMRARSRLSYFKSELSRIVGKPPQNIPAILESVLKVFSRGKKESPQVQRAPLGVVELKASLETVLQDQQKSKQRELNNWQLKQKEMNLYLEEYNSLRYGNTKLHAYIENKRKMEDRLKKELQLPKPKPTVLKPKPTPYQEILARKKERQRVGPKPIRQRAWSIRLLSKQLQEARGRSLTMLKIVKQQ